MSEGYLRWLAALERPAHPTHATEAGGVLDVTVLPGEASLPALTGVLQRLAGRLADRPPRHRVAIVAAAAMPGAAAVYAGNPAAADELAGQIGTLVQEAAVTADTVLVQTLPYAGEDSAAAVEAANAAFTAAAVTAGGRVVALHRGVPLDAMAAAEDFGSVAAALTALGRHDRVSYLWNLIVDAAWAHWQALAPALTDPPKVILSDLDGVLWPGTIAEDGIEGAYTAAGPVGQLTHRLWREHLTRRQQRGVLLAVVSKNEPAAAQSAVDGLEPALSLAGVWASIDIDKTTAVGAALTDFDGIAARHAVVVDDNPGQQERLRIAYPDLHVPAAVAVPLLVQDLLRQIHPGSDRPVTASDRQRTAYYTARRAGELVPEVVCLEDPTDPVTLERLAQLHARTNQFNMTTPRRTAEDLHALAVDPQWSVLAFRVIYHGSDLDDELIGCAEVCYPADGPARLDSFLASCRLLWAGAQRRMFTQIQATVLGRGRKELVARWLPNGRNDTYASWYAHQGWAEPVADGTGWSFTGSTVTRDGESPADLLTVMARYLATAHQPAPAVPERPRRRDVDGAVEMFVPGGPASLGLSAEDTAVVRAVFGLDPIGEAPRVVDLAPYWMDRHLVSRDRFAAFVGALDLPDRTAALAATGEQYILGPVGDVQPAFGTGGLPAVVPWAWAARYAAWVGGRLPSEDEWEFAARGGDGRWFPWGTAMPEPPWCLARGSDLHTMTDNHRGASPFGVHDLVGHVWQWCADTYRGHPQYRGGDTRANPYFLRATVRPLESAEHCGHVVGFRVVRDAHDER